MKKEELQKIIKSPTFLLPAIMVLIGVTVLYVYEFCATGGKSNVLDVVVYWLVYLAISLFLQFVIFVNARRLIINEKKQKKSTK